MSKVSLPDSLTFRGDGGGTIIMLVMDGLGGLPHPDTHRTELESALRLHQKALDESAGPERSCDPVDTHREAEASEEVA